MTHLFGQEHGMLSIPDLHTGVFGGRGGTGAVVGRLCPDRVSLCASPRSKIAVKH